MPKQLTLFICAICALSLWISGCKSTEAQLSAEEEDATQTVNTRVEPEFYQSPPSSTDMQLYGVGTAQLLQTRKSRIQAISQAKEDLISQLRNILQMAIEDYSQDMGMDIGLELAQFTAIITQYIVENIEKSIHTEQISIVPSGRTFALVSLPISLLQEVILSSFADYPTDVPESFQATYAVQYIYSILENNPSTAGSTRSEY